MDKKINNIFIIAPLRSEENHFFLVNGFLPATEISKLDSLVNNKEYLVIVTKENEIDWWAYFWNSQDEENKVNTYLQASYKGEVFKNNEIIFKHIFNVDEAFLNLIQLNNLTILLKDLSIINSIIADITNKIGVLWKNFDEYDKLKHKLTTDWHMTNIPFLNSLFHEEYKKACYLILNDEQKESDYYIKNQSFKSQQNLLLIELDIEDKYSSISKFRIRKIRQTQNHSYSFFVENSVEVLIDISVYIFENYGNWKKQHDQLFMIRLQDFELLHDILENIDEKYRYVWINESNFIDAHKRIDFNEIENSLWKEKNIFGVITREHNYLNRSSDFGSDNKLIVAYGDSKYPELRAITPLNVWHYPRGFSSDGKEYFDDYYLMDTNMFKHFYQNKKFVLVNFDEIPYIASRYYEGCIIDNIERLSMVKVIRLPKFLLEDSFVLTTDLDI
jgi:hypothetical protein